MLRVVSTEITILKPLAMESWSVVIFFAVIAGLFSFFYLISQRHKYRKLPPSPWGIPILGHLHLLGDHPHRSLQKLANIYGPIMSLRLGLIPTMVVSSPEYAELFLKTHDIVFASRSKIQVAECFYGQKSLVLAPYGTFWRNIRKLCTIELLSGSRIELFKSMRAEEVLNFVKSIKSASESQCKIDVSGMVQSILEDMSHRMVFGFKYDRFGNFKSRINEGFELLGAFNVADYIPWLKAFDIQGLGRRMKSCSKVIDGMLETILDEHVRDAKELQGQHRDFLDVMLSLMDSDNTREMHLDRENIKAILLDMIAASIETSSTAIEWVISELLKHPRVMKLVQEELETVVGLDRMVEEKDLIKLSYLKMVIMESMRLHPVGPLLIPHESTEDIIVNGYFIPKKSKVLINIYAIGRDTSVWSSNAQDFFPERFFGTSIDVQGHHFQLLPFGSGRRKCPGLQLGMIISQLIVAQLVHCFNLKLPNGMSPDELDMTEKFGASLPRANHLIAMATYRLPIHID